jgi:hypothetical protein
VAVVNQALSGAQHHQPSAMPKTPIFQQNPSDQGHATEPTPELSEIAEISQI